MAAQKSMLRSTPEDIAWVESMVDNPQTIDTYRAASSRGVEAPLTSIVDPADPYDYILITSNALSSSFQPLIDWKITKGLKARILTTEDIYANYSGTDNPDKIRNFIIDAYTTWASTGHPLQYVLLGGDDEIIPVRYLCDPGSGFSSHGGWMPSDMYYAGLDGNWDADGDGLYGEDEENGSEGEECDFFAEVYVGRMTVDAAIGAMNIVNKTLNYEQNLTADYLNRTLLIGKRLTRYWQGSTNKDAVAELIPQYNVTTLYDRDGTYSDAAVIEEMNDGTHLVNYDGHGGWWGLPISPSQVGSLTNLYFCTF
ncbi:MAG: C25 family cysteine peptidase [Chloroflexota bacterium]|nr:C25 family cysteine peptidase [Chloroflexota bacterium]